MSRTFNFKVMRGTTIRKMFLWSDFGIEVSDIVCMSKEDITSNGISVAARFKCSITNDGLEVYLSSSECQRLINYNRYSIAVQLSNGDVVPCLSGYVEVR